MVRPSWVMGVFHSASLRLAASTASDSAPRSRRSASALARAERAVTDVADKTAAWLMGVFLSAGFEFMRLQIVGRPEGLCDTRYRRRARPLPPSRVSLHQREAATRGRALLPFGSGDRSPGPKVVPI